MHQETPEYQDSGSSNTSSRSCRGVSSLPSGDSMITSLRISQIIYSAVLSRIYCFQAFLVSREGGGAHPARHNASISHPPPVQHVVEASTLPSAFPVPIPILPAHDATTPSPDPPGPKWVRSPKRLGVEVDCCAGGRPCRWRRDRVVQSETNGPPRGLRVRITKQVRGPLVSFFFRGREEDGGTHRHGTDPARTEYGFFSPPFPRDGLKEGLARGDILSSSDKRCRILRRDVVVRWLPPMCFQPWLLGM